MKYKSIRSLIAEGKLKEAIEWLIKEIENSDIAEKNEILIQSMRLNTTLLEKRIGVVSKEESDKTLNQVSHGTLLLLDDIEKKHPQEAIIHNLGLLTQDNSEKIKVIVEQIKTLIIKKGFNPITADKYGWWLSDILNYYPNKDINKIGLKEIKEYCFVYVQKRKKLSSQSINNAISALRVIFNEVLEKNYDFSEIKRPTRDSITTDALTVEELIKLIYSIKNLKHKAIVTIAYSCGLDIKQIVFLRVNDIDFKAKIVKIRSQKDTIERETTLGDFEAEILRGYFEEYKPTEYVFNGFKNSPKYSERSIQYIVEDASKDIGLNKVVSPRSLKYSYIKHFVNAGYSLKTVLSHLTIYHERNAGFYSEIVANQEEKIDKSPFDLFGISDAMSISNAPNNLDKIKKLKMTITKYENELRKRVTNLHNKNTTEKEIDEIIESLEIALNKIKK